MTWVDADNDHAWRDYSEHFRSVVLPQLMSSGMFLSIGSERKDFDVKQATETGAALLLGKPLLLIVPRGRIMPAGLRRAADIIVDDWDATDPNAQQRLSEAITAITQKTAPPDPEEPPHEDDPADDH